MSDPHFRDDPNCAGQRIWRRPTAETWVAGFGTVFLTSVPLCMLGSLPLLLRKPDLSVIIGIPTLIIFMAALAAYAWRDFRGKRKMFIAITSSDLILHLPAYRSLKHKPQACCETVPLVDVAAIETRLEVYGITGLTRQRAYRLVRQGRPAIFLFEDRAIGTTMASETMWEIADEIARRAGVAIRNLGTVRGRSCLYGAWFAAAPPWSTAAISEDRRIALGRRAALLASVLTIAATLAWIVPMIMPHRRSH